MHPRALHALARPVVASCASSRNFLAIAKSMENVSSLRNIVSHTRAYIHAGYTGKDRGDTRCGKFYGIWGLGRWQRTIWKNAATLLQMKVRARAPCSMHKSGIRGNFFTVPPYRDKNSPRCIKTVTQLTPRVLRPSFRRTRFSFLSKNVQKRVCSECHSFEYLSNRVSLRACAPPRVLH